MTGASLFNWDYDRITLQGGVDLFEDAFGKAKKDAEGDEQDIGCDPMNTCYKDYLSTYVFPNNWRTVLRINERSPSFVTNDYVDAMFSGVFGTWPKKKEEPAPTPKPIQEKSDCILM